MGRVYDFNCQAQVNVNRILVVKGMLQPTLTYIYIYILGFDKQMCSRENIERNPN